MRTKLGILKELVRGGISMEDAEREFERMLSEGKWLATHTNDDQYVRAKEAHVPEKRERVAPDAEVTVGKSGRAYVRNPFGKGDYAVASFDSEKAYRSLAPPRYVSEKEMLEDLETRTYYLFTISVDGKKETHEVSLEGEMKDGTGMSDYLDNLFNNHDVEFNYEKCTTTSL